jgi:hypothetical protein
VNSDTGITISSTASIARRRMANSSSRERDAARESSGRSTQPTSGDTSIARLARLLAVPYQPTSVSFESTLSMLTPILEYTVHAIWFT